MASIDLGLPVVTQRVAYTPTLDSGISGSITSTAFWWREGQHINITGLITFSGADGGGAAEDITVALPQGLTIYTNSLPGGTANSNQAGSQLGYGHYFIQGSGWKFIYPIFNTTNSVYFIENTQHITAAQMQPGDGVKYFIQAPVVGW